MNKGLSFSWTTSLLEQMVWSWSLATKILVQGVPLISYNHSLCTKSKPFHMIILCNYHVVEIDVLLNTVTQNQYGQALDTRTHIESVPCHLPPGSDMGTHHGKTVVV